MSGKEKNQWTSWQRVSHFNIWSFGKLFYLFFRVFLLVFCTSGLKRKLSISLGRINIDVHKAFIHSVAHEKTTTRSASANYISKDGCETNLVTENKDLIWNSKIKLMDSRAGINMEDLGQKQYHKVKFKQNIESTGSQSSSQILWK